jgi:hypothetical protein
MIGLTDIVNGLLAPVISGLLSEPLYLSLCQQSLQAIMAAIPSAWISLPETQTELSSLKELAAVMTVVPPK